MSRLKPCTLTRSFALLYSLKCLLPLLFHLMLRLASIENAQREACCGVKRENFLRFARRKWLASDRAAEHVQRVFRGHIGRRRAGLAKEVRLLTGQARAEWVEVSLRKHYVHQVEAVTPETHRSCKLESSDESNCSQYSC